MAWRELEYTNSQIRSLIEEHIHNKRDRDVLVDRLCDGMVFEKLAEKHDLSTQRVKAIVYKAEQRLIKYL